MRLLGLDVGSKRVGVAVSDELGLLAQPVLTLQRTGRRDDVRSILRLLRRYGCTGIVVGNPLHMSGELSPQALKAQAFGHQVGAESGLPVYLWDERLTSAEAHEVLYAAGHARSEHKRLVDQVAAVLILQGYLDAHRPRAPFESGADGV